MRAREGGYFQGGSCPFLAIPQLRSASPASDKVQDERNYSEDEQKVNKPAHYVKDSKAQQPCYQQNHKEYRKDAHKNLRQILSTTLQL